MTKVAIFTRADGGLTVVHFPPEALQDATHAELAARYAPAGAQLIESAALPPTREWRDAWRQHPAGGVHVAMEPARAVAHDRRRALRAAQFEPLDALIARQIPGTDPAAVEAQRAAIRSKNAAAQVAIDGAGTVEALAAALAAAQ